MTNPHREAQLATLRDLAIAASAPADHPSLVGREPHEQPNPKIIDLLLAVGRACNRQGHIARSEECGRADGSLVEIDTADRFARQASSLLHWFGHAFDEDPLATDEPADRELVAEAVAILVGQRLGIEVDGANLAHLACYGITSDDMERLADRILATCLEVEVTIVTLADSLSS